MFFNRFNVWDVGSHFAFFKTIHYDVGPKHRWRFGVVNGKFLNINRFPFAEEPLVLTRLYRA